MTDHKLGATGFFPEGKMNSDDEGELRFAICQEGNNVRIDFNKSVAWLGMPPLQAVELAQHLIHHARAIAKKTGVTLVVTL